jgi:hypothetical protein
MKAKAQCQKKAVVGLDFNKIRNVCAANDTTKKVKTP